MGANIIKDTEPIWNYKKLNDPLTPFFISGPSRSYLKAKTWILGPEKYLFKIKAMSKKIIKIFFRKKKFRLSS